MFVESSILLLPLCFSDTQEQLVVSTTCKENGKCLLLRRLPTIRFTLNEMFHIFLSCLYVNGLKDLKYQFDPHKLVD